MRARKTAFLRIIITSNQTNKDSLPGDCHVALLLAMTILFPQRAKGTHRATSASLLPTGKNIASSLFKDSLPGDCHSTAKRRFAMTLSALHGIKNTLIKKHPFGCLNIVLAKKSEF